MSSFLAALDYHYDLSFKESTDATEVEYLLHSWGEIFPPFLGNREHSDAARFILNDYPFKLFSSNIPYEGSIPYRLTTTFFAPVEAKVEDEVGSFRGVFDDEIAQGFAAFLSMYTRRRVFHHYSTRHSDMPINTRATRGGGKRWLSAPQVRRPSPLPMGLPWSIIQAHALA